MTPMPPSRGKEKPEVAKGSTRGWMLSVLVLTLLGGWAAAGAFYFLQKKDLSQGLFWGTLLSILNFYGLYRLTENVLRRGNRGPKLFWFWNLFRWSAAALACWVLARISPFCLLGAVGSYAWSLMVLTWAGLRDASKGS